MKLSSIPRSLSLLSLLGVLGLSGCAGFDSAIPDSAVEVHPGAIHGSVFGGHAPLVAAHVFIFQAGHSGYGGASTSLLNTIHSTGVTNYPIVEDVSGFPATSTPSGTATNPTFDSYYVPTDASGAFNITGDYTCTAGFPVYLYAAGGEPTTTAIPAGSAIGSAVTVSSGVATFTVSATVASHLFLGEQIGFANIAATNAYAALNNGTQPITALTTTSFSIQVTSLSTGTITAGALVVPYATYNPSAVNIAVLGICPSSSGVEFTNLHYVYVNEVSTVAAAYSLAGFTLTPTSTTDDAAHIGSSSTNAVGITNATITANQLYDIQGSSSTTAPTTPPGEGHIARYVTPGGNGIVPTAMIDTLANILAACVDSGTTYNPYIVEGPGGGSTFPACGTLFEYATSTGQPYNATTPGIFPVDTATAAFNIARNPAGPPGTSGTDCVSNGTSCTWVTAIYGIQPTVVPFTPKLTAKPNDFTLALLYPASKTLTTPAVTVTNPSISSPASIAIDATGDVFFNNHTVGTDGNYHVIKWTPTGVTAFDATGNSGFDYSFGTSVIPGYVSVDAAGDVWIGTSSEVAELNNSGTPLFNPSIGIQPDPYPVGVNSPTFDDAYPIATDGVDNAYVADLNLGSTNRLTQIVPEGGLLFNRYLFQSATNVQTCFGTGAVDINHIATAEQAAGYNLWATSLSGNAVCQFDGNGGHTTPPPGGAHDPSASGVPGGFPVTIASPEFISIDNSANGWITSGIAGAGGLYVIPSYGYGATAATGATFNWPFGSTIDGSNLVWIAMKGSGNLAVFNTGTAAANSPTTNYTLGNIVTSIHNIAADPSGNIWATDFAGNNIVEIVGIATPTYTPISTALLHNKPGIEP